MPGHGLTRSFRQRRVLASDGGRSARRGGAAAVRGAMIGDLAAADHDARHGALRLQVEDVDGVALGAGFERLAAAR